MAANLGERSLADVHEEGLDEVLQLAYFVECIELTSSRYSLYWPVCFLVTQAMTRIHWACPFWTLCLKSLRRKHFLCQVL